MTRYDLTISTYRNHTTVTTSSQIVWRSCHVQGGPLNNKKLKQSLKAERLEGRDLVVKSISGSEEKFQYWSGREKPNKFSQTLKKTAMQMFDTLGLIAGCLGATSTQLKYSSSTGLLRRSIAKFGVRARRIPRT